jgi:hypothetical protein
MVLGPSRRVQQLVLVVLLCCNLGSGILFGDAQTTPQPPLE